MTMPRQGQHHRKASTEGQKVHPTWEQRPASLRFPSAACSCVVLVNEHYLPCKSVLPRQPPSIRLNPMKPTKWINHRHTWTKQGQHLRKIFYHAHAFSSIMLDVDICGERDEWLYVWRCESLIGSNETGFHKNIVQMIPGFGSYQYPLSCRFYWIFICLFLIPIHL